MSIDMEEAVAAAETIVNEAAYDDRTMRALANLCELGGHDEDGVREKYRALIVVRALLAYVKGMAD